MIERSCCRVLSLVLPLSLAAVSPGCAELMTALDTTLSAEEPLDEETVARGLREALRIGSDRTVDATSAVDGFLANELIRIAIPEELDEATRVLRRVGLDSLVDELEVGMNRAAEQASGEARALFQEAVRGLTIEAAFDILRGPDDAATRYLRDRTGTTLSQRIEPIVSEKMSEVGLSRLYADVRQRLEGLPLVQAPRLDLEDYVAGKTLDGIFTVLAVEERKIREDPVARTTELLRRVFGSR